MKFRIPEIAVGALLTVAVFAVGMLFSSQHPQQVVGINPKQGTAESVQGHSDAQHASPGEVKPVSQPEQANRHSDTHEIYGVKPGEFLLFLAAIGLWYATNRLVRDARQTAERQLRAYVHIPEIKMSLLNDSKYDPNIDFVLENFGQTPARRIVLISNAKVLTKPTDADFDLSRANSSGVIDLAPGQKRFAKITVIKREWDKARPRLSKDTAFYVFGRVEYYDVFEPGPRTTKFRVQLLPDADGIQDEMELAAAGSDGNSTT
jgi:hypothetical protein